MASDLPATEDWRDACDADALADAIKTVQVAGTELLLIRNGNDIVACERACPHEFADLSYGHVAEGRIHCPHHRASFDLADGTVSQGWSCRDLRLFPARVADGKVWVDASDIATSR
ncbi:anthranilate 1,2-dioxygenase ferredoxin subunit [Variibacter gotjawalensis]|uniref:Anthranilate 1,2-dioxygenase ferredoxin subunit n=1 Tax=Variibacter gotjawalensis TaxID=1333996 RepID=A0A0S3PZU4_9BRAD|nr:Rieske (2Fe-2S) protein [Variibacter gotjawalensis]NIK47282.1 nitrite reductase/ring-hydroxylating ferredoxin subunit [Variibacter gotjawalensis]RZS49182.1 3-phenylpropionate/trans-cinnamate dioxygenase ferredoxin subunit [Variibacter gotjawalensis]BAT61444.1 anthranilate 1,2-dioxygenase ferredoxin subunit [Variibacter gotjawalensis]